MKSVLCLIPARSGSKGLKNKNIKLLNKVPLLIYPYKIAKNSKFITDIAVSSDSRKYLKFFRGNNVIKILRPRKLSTSKTNVVDVIFHALSQLKKKYQYLVLLEPTSPFTSSKELDHAFKFIIRNNDKVHSLLSVVSNSKFYNVFRAKFNKNFKLVKKLNKKYFNRQSVPSKEFFFSGNFYISKISYLKKTKSFIGKKTYCYPIKKSIHTDIDNIYDFVFAEALLKKGLFKIN